MYHRSTRRKKKLNEDNLCSDCGKRPIHGNQAWLCEPCAEKKAKRSNERYKKRAGKGVCVDCGKQHGTERVRCPECAEKHAFRMREKRAKQS